MRFILRSASEWSRRKRRERDLLEAVDKVWMRRAAGHTLAEWEEGSIGVGVGVVGCSPASDEGDGGEVCFLYGSGGTELGHGQDDGVLR